MSIVFLILVNKNVTKQRKIFWILIQFFNSLISSVISSLFSVAGLVIFLGFSILLLVMLGRKSMSNINLLLFSTILVFFVQNLNSFFMRTVFKLQEINDADHVYTWTICFFQILLTYFLTLLITSVLVHWLFDTKNMVDRYQLFSSPSIFFTQVIFLFSAMILTGISEHFEVQSSFFELLIAFYGLMYYYSIFTLFVTRSQLMSKLNVQKKNHEIATLTQYNDELERNMTDYAALRHDVKNILIASGVEDGKIEKNLGNDFIRQNAPNLKNISEQTLRGLLLSKILEAHSFCPSFSVEVQPECPKIPMNKIDLIRVVGILLDNALDASRKVIAPKIEFAIIPMGKSIEIIVRNLYNSASLPLSELSIRGCSSKQDKGNHGFGLHNVRQIVRQNNNLSMEIDKTNNMFSVILYVEGI